MPPRWKVDILAERLVRELQKEIGMAQSFFHEGSVLVLVFGILDTWVNGKLTPPVGGLSFSFRSVRMWPHY